MLPKRKFILRSSVDTRRKSFALNGNDSEGTKVLGGNEREAITCLVEEHGNSWMLFPLATRTIALR